MSKFESDVNAVQTNSASVKKYINSPQKQQQLYRRTLWTVIFAQVLGGAGLAAGITVGALIAIDILGTDSFAGLPIALFTLGSAGAAMVIGRLSQRYSRRLGLAVGFITGGIGAIGVILATMTQSILLLFVSLLIYGSGTATNLQARYAGTDLATAKQRGTAVSLAMVATTFGAVAGPNLVDVMGDFAVSIGIPSLAGPFILAAVAYILAGLVPLIFLRPDPLVVSKAVAAARATDNHSMSTEEATADEGTANKRGVYLGATVMVISQIVMVAIMTMTPVHMGEYGFTMQQIGMVIGLHIAGMYLPSPLTGILVDKLGRMTMAVVAGITLCITGLLAAFAPGDSLLFIAIALILLGIGWNFGLISGTALIVDSTVLSTRAKTQGSVDVFIALSGAIGGALSGVIVAAGSFEILSIGGGILSLVLIPAVLWARNFK
ncbi:MFS transporter [Sporosarcina pasteurii]|uniref:MFS transporter, aromatic acid:H+ symporter (AAHS) family n=1 Tax=Sporosarcina pasteurii TaxID=1474 RepID=A0A380C1K9_SPOPA|nr:MFS transporter [Sporosarcina pasteurii]MDS9471561.1 MFS transporter [Sporosarcina pasteurii]QBQ04824.1 MFS transporter [Sporosarcina pasteurii]SUJ11090.1 MFS transporter, aromatic acid:H+ symporter (AAHS) family [Sporosarcina pasteurii]